MSVNAIFFFDVFGFCSGTRTCKGYSIREFLLVPLNNLLQKWVYIL